MRLFPSVNFAIASALPLDEARASLFAALVAPPTATRRWWSSPEGAKQPLIGTLLGDQVRCWRRLGHRNSFQPTVVAQFTASPEGGSRLEGRLALNPLVAGFMAVWLGFVAVFLLIGAGSLIAGVENASPLLVFIPLGMLLFGVASTHLGFAMERADTLRCLHEVLKATGSAAGG